MGNNLGNNVFEIRYKYINPLFTTNDINIHTDTTLLLVLIEEAFKTYLRESLDKYLFLNFDNFFTS